MATNISANQLLNSYSLFNATDIKQFLIDQLNANPENPFKDVDYLGSNINAFIDIIAVMLQQIQFSYSLNTSEASFSNAMLYESMSKIVSLLNYKTVGKQTSMLPVNISIDASQSSNAASNGKIIIPKFLTINYNKPYVLLEEQQASIFGGKGSYDTVFYQGSVHESQIFEAAGDDFETINIPDPYINNGGTSFISDNFFTVYVDENNDGRWKEYSESACLFLENALSEKYERRFTEDFGYEFKFGNGTYGKKLNKDARIVIYYLISDGETAEMPSNSLIPNAITVYKSSLYNSIRQSNDIEYQNYDLLWFSARNTGPTTAISYPESVASIRKNAPKVFASQNRLYSLNDYTTFISKNFSNYCKHIYTCKNDEYISDYLKYYYDLGLTAPQEDSRASLAQVEFMTSTHFNNIYSFIVPTTNTIIDGKVPNYLNTALKKQIVNKCSSLMGPTHNLVIMDPIHRAFCFGSPSIYNEKYNKYQVNNRIFLIRKKNSQFEHSYIKNYTVAALNAYFSSLQLGSTISCMDINGILNSIPGTSGFYIQDVFNNKDSRLYLYAWNPLYQFEDNKLISQSYICKNFEYPYFYDINNLENIINVIDA